jgi:hypothetical protein
MQRHSEQPACPRSGSIQTAEAALRGRQVEKAGKVCWNAEQQDRDWASHWGAGIARQSLSPG